VTQLPATPAPTAPVGRATIAVVIPTYERAHLIGRAIETALTQRRPPNELFVVDDGSTDSTEAVVRSYENDVKYVRKDNGGVSSARNRGVELAVSDFIAFLDSDDIWYDDHLARISDAMDATSGRAVLYFSDLDLAEARGGGSGWDSAGFSIPGSHELADRGLSWALRPIQPMFIQASVINRGTYRAIGGCSERLACREDTHLFLKLALAGASCAVAGRAGLLSGDAGESSLSNVFGSSDLTYLECSRLLYQDFLDIEGKALTRSEKRVISRRLAQAHWDLAVRLGRRCDASAAPHLAHALRIDPRMAVRRVRGRVKSLLAREA
jgi:glycosyltransferase involved in cell wall biosynthesis